MKRKGAEILVEALIKENVEVIFGYPGGAVIPICDVLYDVKEIKFILTRHEQAAAHAADGYARATGKVGVCMATSGPGATNLVTGIATAYMDSIPLVAITGQVKTNLIGNDAFQEADVTGITRPITKHNYLVTNVDDLPRILREAFYIARTGRPGPVLIDLPVDITTAQTSVPIPDKVEIRGYKPVYSGNPRQIKLAAQAIAKAKRPVVYAGGGVISANASEELRKFIDKTGIPITNTLMGLGGIPGDHPLFLGMLGMHGTVYANYAIMNSDLIIAIGARFDDRITGKIDSFAPHAKIIHIDIDPTSISKNIKVDIPIVGDCKDILKKLTKECKKCEISEWLNTIEEWKRKYALKYDKNTGLKPQYIVETLYKLTKGDIIMATEVGQNQMWAVQWYKFLKPRTLLTSGGLGTMGYGFPAAIGAQIAFPEKLVVDIAGDGSFQMNIQELNTAVRLNLPIKIILLNNAYLGMVRQWQELFFNKRYSQTDMADNPDFVKIAEAYGAKAMRITDKKDVEPALREALKERCVYLLDFIINREENVFPMVPAGEALDRMIGGMA